MDYSHFLIIAGLIFVNAYFVAAEFALVKVRTSQIDQLVEEGSWAARMTSRRWTSSTSTSRRRRSASRWRAWRWAGRSRTGSSPWSSAAFEADPLPTPGHAWPGSLPGSRPALRAMSGLMSIEVIPGFSVGIVPVAALTPRHLPAHGAGRAGPQDPGDPRTANPGAGDGPARWCSSPTSSGR